MGFPNKKDWNELPFPTLGDLPDPGIELASLALADGFLTTEPPGKPQEDMFSSVQSLSRVRLFETS